jgi:hypothetical protein
LVIAYGEQNRAATLLWKAKLTDVKDLHWPQAVITVGCKMALGPEQMR